MADEYRVELENYNGPLDLLLFLIRREEIDVYDIPIARLTEQYLHYVDLLRHLDPDQVSEFLVLAATLMEIKSRMLLPSQPAEEQEDFVDPRLDLVRQLLEYKQFKDLAMRLGSAAADQAERFGRLPILPSAASGDDVELDHVQVWDLVSAFGRLLAQIGLAGKHHEIVYDDTPVALHAADILDRLAREGRSMEFSRVFEGRNKGEIIGLFLALLELIRGRRIRAEQDASFDTIMLHLLDDTPLDAPDQLPAAAPRSEQSPGD